VAAEHLAEAGAAAPLISIPEAPAPKGGTAEWFEGHGGARLRAALFPCRSKAKGSVVLSPGRTEPIEKYFEVVRELNGRGLVVLAHDWRGQGLSERMLPDRLAGHAQGFEAFLGDYTALLDAFQDRLPRPWIGFAHSMGACLQLLAMVKGEGRLQAAFHSAPMLAVKTGPWPLWFTHGVVAATGAFGLRNAYALPVYDPLADAFAADRLTHDQVRYQCYKAQLRACPDLAIGAVTWGWIDFALKACAAISAPGALEAISTPVAFVAAGDDRLVLNGAARIAARRLPNGSYTEIAGAYHEVLMETDAFRTEVWAAFDGLVRPLISPRA
jgi:lysophospholipase